MRSVKVGVILLHFLFTFSEVKPSRLKAGPIYTKFKAAEKAEVNLEKLILKQNVSKSAQGMHASINRPSKESFRNSEIARFLEFATYDVESSQFPEFPGKIRKTRQARFQTTNRRRFNDFGFSRPFNPFDLFNPQTTFVRNRRPIFRDARSRQPLTNSRPPLTISRPTTPAPEPEEPDFDFPELTDELFESLDNVSFVDADKTGLASTASDPVLDFLGTHGVSILNDPICDLEGAEMACDPEVKYRSLSGRCNNLKNPVFGKHIIPLKRLLPAEYDDGIARPRISSKAEEERPLPNVRTVSQKVHYDKSNPSSSHTLMLMQWGQFLDHDITSTPMARGHNGSILDCSACDANGINRNCYPILVPRADTFFPRQARDGSKRCIPFTRSIPGQTKMGPREQLNQNTAFIDASHLYGSHPCRASELRSYKNGLLLTLDHPGSRVFKALMPRHAENDECHSPLGLCFHTGDDRNNEQPGLTALHTLFLREHNRLAGKLSAINPHWNDDKSFQEARKILMAENQHITYNEFLPRVLGSEVMTLFDLDLRPQGHFYGDYDPTCSPDIFNEFATAAFRFGHSLIRPMFVMMSQTMKVMAKATVRLREHFNNPDVVYSAHFIDQLVRGLVSHPMEQFDNTITEELTNHLFNEKGHRFSGMDLAALNLQRGRDHGLPGYIHYQRYCAKKMGLEDVKVESLNDLHKIFRPEAAKAVSDLYRHIEDIDLFTGGLSEIPFDQMSQNGAKQGPFPGILGPTFACLVAEQFRNLRRCDRFWFETRDEKIGFKIEQLNEIRTMTLSSLVCANADVQTPLPRMAMDLPHNETNPYLRCHDSDLDLEVKPKGQTHPDINIELWREIQNTTREGRKNFAEEKSAFCDFGGRIVLPGTQIRVSACVSCLCQTGNGKKSGKTGNSSCQTVRVSREGCGRLIQDVGREAVGVDNNCEPTCRARAGTDPRIEAGI